MKLVNIKGVMVMKRFVVVVLLLAVFFFGGMTYGNVEKQSIQEKPSEFIEIENEFIENVDIIPYETEVVRVDVGTDRLNKTAGFFEKVVNSFYEGIITILYSIAGLFFD